MAYDGLSLYGQRPMTPIPGVKQPQFGAQPFRAAGGGPKPMDGFQTGQLALGGAGALADLWASLQGIKLGKQQLAESGRQFNLNFGAQRKTVNSQLEDRQRARNASSSNGYESTGAYLDKNRI